MSNQYKLGDILWTRCNNNQNILYNLEIFEEYVDQAGHKSLNAKLWLVCFGNSTENDI